MDLMICSDLFSLLFLIGSSLFLTVLVMDLRSASDVGSLGLIQENRHSRHSLNLCGNGMMSDFRVRGENTLSKSYVRIPTYNFGMECNNNK